MGKALTIKNILKKVYKVFTFDGVWKLVFGSPEIVGLWLIWGAEKHGKTWFAILLAQMLSAHRRVLYISGEEGIKKTFQETLLRAGITDNDPNLKFKGKEDMPEILDELRSHKGPQVVIIDNTTAYEFDLTYGGMQKIHKEFSEKKLLIFLGHEENGKPHPSPSRVAKRLADVIIHVKGLTCFVSGRCPGGVLTINEEKAKLFHGNEIQTEKAM